jgi:hypothetical protein
MPKSLQLTITDPCHEDWQKMAPEQQGRFCGSCQKTVVDFSIMSDQEVLNYFLQANHKICGRFAADQLNRELVITEKKKRFSWAYVWNVLLATFLLTDANAQVKPKPKKTVKTIITEEKMGDVAYMPIERIESVMPVNIKGRVTDAKSNQSVIGASVRVKSTTRGVMADTLGNFQFPVEKKDSLVLEFSAIGYETQTLVIDGLTNWQDVQVFLKPVFVDLQPVTVKGYSNCTLTDMVGGIGARYTITKSEKIKRNINNWVPAALKKDVKIFPNPVVRGNSIQVNLALKQAGDYKVEVLNTAGQIMLVQPLKMPTKEKVVQLYTETAWSAGIYWIRISSPYTKNVYQSKLLLQ